MNENYQNIEEDEIDLGELFSTIKENSLTILFITILFISVAVGTIYWGKNIYSSSTIISLDSKGQSSLGIGSMLSQVGLGGMGGMGGSGADIEKAKIVLTSKKFLKDTLDKIETKRDYFIQRNFRKVEVDSFLNFKIDIYYKDKEIAGNYFKITPMDKKSFLLEVDKIEYKEVHKFNKKIFNQYFSLLVKKTEGIDPYEMNLTTGNILSNIIDKNFDFENKSYIFRDVDSKEQIEKLIDNITIEDKKSNIMELKYQGTLPEKTKDIISIVTETFIEYQLKNKMEEFNRNLYIINNQISNISLNMDNQIKKIEKFQEKNNLSVSSNGADIVNTIYNKKQQQENLSLQIQEVENFINSLNGGVLSSVALTSAGIDTFSIQKLMDSFISTTNAIRELELQQNNIDRSITSNPIIASFIETLKNKKDLQDMLLTDFTEEHPQVIKQKQEIENLIDKINMNILVNLNKLKKNRDVTKSTILTNISMVEKSLYKKLTLLKNDIKKKESLLNSIPSNRMLSSRLNKTFSFNDNIYSVLLNKKIEIEIEKTSLIANTKILEDAYVAEKADTPKVALILMVGTITGMILGIFFIFLRSFADGKIRTLRDIEKLTDIPVFGTLSIVKHNKEELRRIRTHIQLKTDSSRCTKILISSIVEGEGKTTLSVGLAQIMAEAGKKVLIMDLDLRNPRLHQIFNQPNSVGITNYLLENSELSDILLPINKNLDFIPSGLGALDVSALLMSSRLEHLMSELEKEYDYIIFDTASVKSALDLKIMLKHSDVMLLSIMANMAEKKAIEEFNQRIKENDDVLSGIVLVMG